MNRSTYNWIGSTIQFRHCYERVTHVGNDFLCTSCHQLTRLFPNGETNRRRGHASPASSSLQPRSALRLRMQSFPAASTATALTSCTAYGLRSPTHPPSA
jgi:hypothetical protein